MVSVIATAIANRTGREKANLDAPAWSGQDNNCLSIAMSRIRDRLEEAAAADGKRSDKIAVRSGFLSDTLTIFDGVDQVSYYLGQGQYQGIFMEAKGGRQIPVCATVESFRCSMAPGDSIKIELIVRSTADSGKDNELNGRRFASMNFALR